MKTMVIGKSEISAPVLSLGAFAMGGGTAWADTRVDEAAFAGIFYRARELGCNMIDTAPVYGTGQSEEMLGRILAGRRQDYILATKCSLNWREARGTHEYDRDGKSVWRCFDRASLRADLEDSFRRLKTDYLDLYIVHRQPPIEDVAPVMDTLCALKREGKIRAIGISNASPAILQEYLRHGQVDLVQEYFSLLSHSSLAEYIPLCEREGVTFQTYRSLEEGALSGSIKPGYLPAKGDVRGGIKWLRPDCLPKVLGMLDRFSPLCEKYGCSPAALAFAWVLAQTPAINLLVGVRRMETLLDTIGAVDLALSPEDCAFMLDCAKEIQ